MSTATSHHPDCSRAAFARDERDWKAACLFWVVMGIATVSACAMVRWQDADPAAEPVRQSQPASRSILEP